MKAGSWARLRIGNGWRFHGAPQEQILKTT
jgi:hypothetical protein